MDFMWIKRRQPDRSMGEMSQRFHLAHLGQFGPVFARMFLVSMWRLRRWIRERAARQKGRDRLPRKCLIAVDLDMPGRLE